jgi:hypothetical protein
MGRLKRLFGKPDRDDFAQMMTRALDRAGMTREIQYDGRNFRLLFGGRSQLYLDNAHSAYLQLPRFKGERRGLVQIYIRLGMAIARHSSFKDLPQVQQVGIAEFLRSLRGSRAIPLLKYRVLIFGSYANDSQNPWSDLDLAVVSKGFQGVPWKTRVRVLKSGLPRNGCLINPVGVTDEELEKHRYPTILRTIKAQGIELI